MLVTTPPEGSPPSFLDWFDMVRLLCECEVEKYATKYGYDPADPEQWERWTVLPRQFLTACFEKDVTYEELRDRFGLPR